MTTSTWPCRIALCALLQAAAPAAALTPNRSLSLRGGLDLPGAAPAAALAAGCWLDGELEAVAGLSLRAARRPEVRAAAAVLSPSIGLRWAPDAGRWRPTAVAELGVQLRFAGRAAAAASARLGVEWLTARDAGLSAGLGLRWAEGRGTAAEAVLEATLYF